RRANFCEALRKGRLMTVTKLIVAYPQPLDVEAFDKVYFEEHVPLAVAKLSGKTKMVATKILGSPKGAPAFYRVAEISRARGDSYAGRRLHIANTYRTQDGSFADRLPAR
ncbi:MAG TPA: EthD family reductase, partial [Bryobacteraceae bacterium]|nr:EthD family reductase [Bryobacteraceae bacterium]